MIENLGDVYSVGWIVILLLLSMSGILLTVFSMFLLAGLRLPVPVKEWEDCFYYKEKRIWGDSGLYMLIGFIGWLITILVIVPLILGLFGSAIGLKPP